MKKINLKYIGLGIFTLICIPILIDRLIIGNNIKSNIDNSDWVSFLGSYLGSILGVLGVFLVTKIDQIERESERKDALFLNNISLYRNILSLMDTRQLSSLQKGISEFKDGNNWSAIDTLTKQKLKNIEDDLYYANERTGLFNIIKNFIQANLSNELEVTMSTSGDEFNEPIEYEGIPDPLLNSVTAIIINSLEIDLLYENSIYVEISKKQMMRKLKDDKYSKEYTDAEIDVIYRKVCKIGRSNEWIEYLERRSEIFNNITKLRKEIEERIKKVLTY